MERLLCFCGGDVADGAEKGEGANAIGPREPPNVVIPIDPFHRFPFDFAHRFPRADLVDDFGSEQADDALGQRIAAGAADGSDRKINLGICQSLGIYLIDRYCDPRSEWWTKALLSGVFLCQIA